MLVTCYPNSASGAGEGSGGGREPIADFGKLVHYFFDRWKTHENNLDPKCGECIFFGIRWRIEEFIIGTAVEL